MFSALRRRLTYTNVGVTLALFFSMSGGALAASHYLITSTKQIKPSVLSALRGKAGAAGANGAAGPAGPAGGQGVKGETGATGLQGPEGKEGKEGKPGKEGKAGKEGSPWTAGGTLPPEKTETGAWSASGTASTGDVCIPNALEGPVLSNNDSESRCPSGYDDYEVGNYAVGAISFTIPLEKPLGEEEVHYLKYEERIAGKCEGSFEEPTAAPGNLCVYVGSAVQNAGKGLVIPPGLNPVPGALKAGAVVFVLKGGEVGEEVLAAGTWAVTAPKEEK
jgi:hypothetical protein